MKKIIKKLECDSDFFNIPIFRTLEDIQDENQIAEIDKAAREQNVGLIYHFQSLAGIGMSSVLNLHGFRFIQQHVTLRISKLTRREINKNIRFFDAASDDIQSLETISRQISDKSRFAFEPALKSPKVLELYDKWIYNSCFNGFSDYVLVYEQEKTIKGLCTLDIEGKSASIKLIGVDKKYRRSGAGKALVNGFINLAIDKGCSEVSVVTQTNNLEALNFYFKTGFIIADSNYIFHKIY